MSNFKAFCVLATRLWIDRTGHDKTDADRLLFAHRCDAWRRRCICPAEDHKLHGTATAGGLSALVLTASSDPPWGLHRLGHGALVQKAQGKVSFGLWTIDFVFNIHDGMNEISGSSYKLILLPCFWNFYWKVTTIVICWQSEPSRKLIYLLWLKM